MPCDVEAGTELLRVEFECLSGEVDDDGMPGFEFGERESENLTDLAAESVSAVCLADRLFRRGNAELCLCRAVIAVDDEDGDSALLDGCRVLVYMQKLRSCSDSVLVVEKQSCHVLSGVIRSFILSIH